MKQKTAFKHVFTIAKRLKSLNGLIATPCCLTWGIKIKKAWVFGSTVKGSLNPNDVDIIIESVAIPNIYRKKGRISNRKHHGDTVKYRTIEGYLLPLNSYEQALKSIARGMRNISVHNVDIDEILSFPRIMIYPKMLFNPKKPLEDQCEWF